MKLKLEKFKEEIEITTILAGEFNNPLWIMDRNLGDEWGYRKFGNTINKLALTNIYRT